MFSKYMMDQVPGADMTPLDRVEALYASLLTHYGNGEDREIRAASKLLLVALDTFRQYGGSDWPLLVNEFLEIATREPEKFEKIIKQNRNLSFDAFYSGHH